MTIYRSRNLKMETYQDIDISDLAWIIDGEIVIVATLFCAILLGILIGVFIVSLREEYRFVSEWKKLRDAYPDFDIPRHTFVMRRKEGLAWDRRHGRFAGI